MKRFLALLLAFIAVAAAFSGCAGAGSGSDSLKIITTIFPLYDWTKNITDGTDADVKMLLDNGVDLHSFQPSAQDIVDISTCDVFIYVGGESDKWVDDALKEKTNENMTVIDLMDALKGKTKTEELKEGMESGEDDEEPETDEHIWLSLKNAEILCEYISDKLQSADKSNAEEYEKNAQAYIKKLEKLDGEYKKAVDSAKQKTLVFGDRFPFRYLVDDYGLDYFAAFKGCEAETEASFKTIVFLAKKLDELKMDSIIKLESSDGSIAKTIVENTKKKNQKVLTLDSMQSTTSEQIDDGATYLSAAENNLKTLKKALH